MCMLQDKACEDVDYRIRSSSSSGDSESSEEPEEEERRKQEAIMEKERVSGTVLYMSITYLFPDIIIIIQNGIHTHPPSIPTHEPLHSTLARVNYNPSRMN